MADQRYLGICKMGSDQDWYAQPIEGNTCYTEEGPFASVEEAIRIGREVVEAEWIYGWSRDSYILTIDE